MDIMDNDERRQYQRISVDFEVAIVATEGSGGAEIMRGESINISKNGLCLKTDYEASISSLLFLSIVYGGRDSLFLAEVVWRTPKDKGFIYGLHIRHWTHLDPTLEREVMDRPLPVSSEFSAVKAV